jgi:hypothetical protein
LRIFLFGLRFFLIRLRFSFLTFDFFDFACEFFFSEECMASGLRFTLAPKAHQARSGLGSIADFDLAAVLVTTRVTLDFKSEPLWTGRYPEAKQMIWPDARGRGAARAEAVRCGRSAGRNSRWGWRRTGRVRSQVLSSPTSKPARQVILVQLSPSAR